MLEILVGLVPALLLRWVILRKQTSIGVAIGTSFGLLIGIVIVLDAMEKESAVLGGAVAAGSFFILRSGDPKTSKDDYEKQ